MNIDGALLTIFGAAAAAAGVGLADITALVVAVGTLIAGIVHARRLRIDRSKVVEEVTSSVQARLERENELAWKTVDHLRDREAALEAQVARLEAQRRELELRVAELERRTERRSEPRAGAGE